MRSQTWKSCLGVLCLLAAGTANAAKISFSEKGFVDVGALVQAQYRIEQDAAGSGKDPSNDFLLRRARLILSGQFNEHVGFIIDTDITYGAAVLNGPTGGTAWNNNIYLLDALASYKVSKELIIDAGLMLLPYSHSSLTSSAKYVSVSSTTPVYLSPASNRGFRDAGILIRGLLLDDRLYYRLGVFNGVQTRATTTTGTPPVTTQGINPGDAPRFAGMLRFNFAGKEDGYAFCEICFAKSPIINLGVSADYQANAFRGSAPTGPGTSTSTGMGSWTVANADFFADIPFSDDLELSFMLQGTKVWAGTNTPQSGLGIFGVLGMRFGVIGPYVQIEWFNSDAQYVGRGNTAGDLTTYRGGINWYIQQTVYKVSAEIAFQNKEKAGETIDGTAIPPNHWVGTLQFSVNF